MSDLGASLWAIALGVRACGGLKKLDRRPPVLLRAVSRTDCVRVMGVMGVGGIGGLIVLVRRTEGLVAMYPRLGSRADALLHVVSYCGDPGGGPPYLLNFGTSSLRTGVDPEPECGV